MIVSKVGRELYEKFFRGYTRKQWGLDPSELDAAVTARVPVRTNRDDRYFTDTYQAMPLHGYTRMFERMLDAPEHQDHAEHRLPRDRGHAIPYGEMIYTGPIDEYFDFRFGKLPYRSLEFQFETLDARTRPAGRRRSTIRTTTVHPGHRVQAPDRAGARRRPRSCTSIRSAEGDPYYPVPRPENAALYRQYQELADAHAGRALRRPAGDLQVLQHGPGRRPRR